MFYGGLSASFASKILRIDRNTINVYYHEIREKILQHSLKEREEEFGEFELDESYFRARRVRGKMRARRNCNQRLQPLTAESSVMRTNLRVENPILTAWNTFGVTPNGASRNSTV